MRNNCNKVVLENFFEPCILYLLLEKENYGYELSKKLKNHCGCIINVGNLYRGLSRLQKANYIVKKKAESKIGPNRFVYAITPKGKKLLKEWIADLDTQKEIIGKLITNYQTLTHDIARSK